MTLLEKYYLVDLGLLQLKSKQEEDQKIQFIMNYQLEDMTYILVKLIMEKQILLQIIFYIQVADYLSSDDVVKREFGAYKNVEYNFPKYVITMDKINYSQNGIIHKNIIDLLLEK